MFIPIILVVVLLVSVFVISKRENLEELNNSPSNILNIDNLKS
jgi:cell division protein FtsL